MAGNLSRRKSGEPVLAWCFPDRSERSLYGAGPSGDPIIIPLETYELSGFFGQVVFTNGHIVNGDELTIYYGAADEFVCGAKFSIVEILKNRIII
jgi:predicted GH43/DUF377 family glycosyl hydrolase